MAKHSSQSVLYMNKDKHFLADGVWYITTPCPAMSVGGKCLAAEGKTVDEDNGLIDEEITWDEAKTPHHAGLIADRRHFECARAMDEQIIAESREMEIRAAEYEVKRIDRVLAEHKELLAKLEADESTHPLELEQAHKRLADLEPGPAHARQRLADTIATNR